MANRLVFILLAAVAFPDPAQACSCDMARPCESLWGSDLVFIGRAQRVVKATRGSQEARFVVEEWLRGERVGTELTIFSYGVGGSCDYGFDQGTRYLAYARKRPDGTWGVFLCSGTSPLERAASALRYIRAALHDPGDGTLSGHGFVDIDPGERVRSGPPISGVRLFLRSPYREFMTRTGKDGQYRFVPVPAGEYTLDIELPASYHPVPTKRIVIGKGACLQHVFYTTKR